MLTIVIHIFQHLISSTFVSDVYGLMRRILYQICIASCHNETVRLVQHGVITNYPLYGIAYLYAALLFRMNLSQTL